VADAAVDRLGEEGDAPRLEVGAGRLDVLDVKGDRVGAGLERAADRLGVHHLQGQVAGLELAAGDLVMKSVPSTGDPGMGATLPSDLSH
jgi:hypothetical protein